MLLDVSFFFFFFPKVQLDLNCFTAVGDVKRNLEEENPTKRVVTPGRGDNATLEMPDRRVIYDGLSRLTSVYLCVKVRSVRECRVAREREERHDFFSTRRKRIEATREKYANSSTKSKPPRLLVALLSIRSRLPASPPSPTPFPLVPTSLRPWPDRLPDRKLINECKRANVVDKFNKIVHAQLATPGVNTFWRISSLSNVQESATSHPSPLCLFH